ncbi:response regulator [Dyella jiangningensis]|nr:response regulator [Dyella jiangningensis]
MADAHTNHGTVLIVEDDYLIASTMSAALELADWHVLGPFPSVATARHALDNGQVASVAVLDVNLGGERAFPLIDRLVENGIPVVLTTGYDEDAIPPAYADLKRLQKPVRLHVLIDCLNSMLKH